MTTRGKVVVTILIVLGVLLLAWFLREAVRIVDTDQTISVRTVPPAPPDAESSEAFRAYRNPVHAGGINSVADLRRLIQQHPDIAQHYKDAGFDANCATEEILAVNTWSRVSFRTATGFAMTSQPVLILAGETIFADQCHSAFVRARCANILLLGALPPQISADSPQGGFLIPPPDDLPLPPTDIVPSDVPPAPPGPPTTPPGPPTTPPFYPPPTCCFVGFAPPPGSPTAVPEPSTWLLLAAGIAAFVGFKILRGLR